LRSDGGAEQASLLLSGILDAIAGAKES